MSLLWDHVRRPAANEPPSHARNVPGSQVRSSFALIGRDARGPSRFKAFILRLRHVDLVVLHITGEMPVFAPLDCLIQISTSEQKKLEGEIDLGKSGQPNAFCHACLLDYYCGPGP